MPQNKATISIGDYDNEQGRTSVNIGPLTAVNFTAKRDAIDDYKAAVADMVAGEVRAVSITESFAESADPVTDENAQRESKWLVTYRDVTQFLDVANTIANVGFGNLYTVEIPTAKLSLLPSFATDLLDLAGTVAAAFCAAFEALQNSPTGGNETEVVEIRHVGRAT